MDIEVVNQEEQISIRLWGRMDGDGADQFAGKVAALQPAQGQSVVLDMDQLTFIGSAGIGKLVGFLKRVTAAGATISTINLTRDLRALFKIMRLDRLFNVTSM